MQSSSSKGYIKALVRDSIVVLTATSDAGDATTTTYQPGDICIPFTCPSSSYNPVIVTLSGTLPEPEDPTQYTKCEIFPLSGLRLSSPFYNIIAEHGKLNEDGIYESLDRCRGSNGLNFSILCSTFTNVSPYTNQGNEWRSWNSWKLLQKLQQLLAE